MTYRILAATFLAIFTIVACTNRELRGAVTPSSDGKTYLAVVDDNGGKCGPIKVDGKVWPHPIGQPGVIEPGKQTLACGTEIDFSIPAGSTFWFDYWGP